MAVEREDNLLVAECSSCGELEAREQADCLPGEFVQELIDDGWIVEKENNFCPSCATDQVVPGKRYREKPTRALRTRLPNQIDKDFD